MKKLSVFFTTALVFVFFSFSSVIFAQDESENPSYSTASLQERREALNAEKEGIKALQDEVDRRMADYNIQCKGKSFDLADRGQKQIANECQAESEWLISTQKGIKERLQKYNADLAQLTLDTDAYQRVAIAKLRERSDALNTEKEAISALRDEYVKRKDDFDAKCQSEELRFDTEEAMQIVKDCQDEREWLISSQKSLTERQQKYNADLAQYRLDYDAFQRDTAAIKGD